MKMAEADVIWTPAQADTEDAGKVRIERHLSQWQRSRGDRWMPAATLMAYDEVPTKAAPLLVMIEGKNFYARRSFDVTQCSRHLEVST